MKESLKRNVGIVIALIVLFVSSSVFAQPPDGGGQSGIQIPSSKQIKKMVTELSKELSLNDEQEASISKMYTAHFAEVKKATSSGRPDRNKMEALKTKFEKGVNAVLTKEQQKKFVAYQKKNEKRQGPPNERR